MSTPVRWIIAIVMIMSGVLAALFVVFGGAFSTVACTKTPVDWVYYVLLVDGVLTLAAAIIPAVMLLRRARAARIALGFAMGIVLSCAGYGVYMAMLGNNC
jgi:predicted transporter